MDIVFEVPGKGCLTLYCPVSAMPAAWSLGEPGGMAAASGEVQQLARGLVLKQNGQWAGFLEVTSSIAALQTDPVGKEFNLKLADGAKDWVGKAKLAARKASQSALVPPALRHAAATAAIRFA
jgi:hypothetical protein